MNRAERSLQRGDAADPRGGNGTAAPPQPHQDPQTKRMWRLAERISLVGIFVILVGAALIHTRPVAVPVVAAILIGNMIGFAGEALAKRRIPPLLAAFVIVAAFLGGIYVLIAAFLDPLTAWIGRSGEMGTLLSERFRFLRAPLAALDSIQESLRALTGGDKAPIAVDVKSTSMLQNLVEILTPALSQMFIFVGTLVFFIAGRVQLKRKLVVTFLTREARLTTLRILTAIERNLATYLGTVTVINAGLGALTGVVLWGLGVPSPGLWGLMVFVLNYLPFIGPLLATLVLLGVGFVTYTTMLWSLLPAGAFLVLHGIETLFVTPSVIGRRLTMNPFLVFIALAFWTWVWGVAGAFMAVPLLVVSVVVIEHLFPADDVELPG
jgi:predicted PurR-regulated permease PerM